MGMVAVNRAIYSYCDPFLVHLVQKSGNGGGSQMSSSSANALADVPHIHVVLFSRMLKSWKPIRSARLRPKSDISRSHLVLPRSASGWWIAQARRSQFPKRIWCKSASSRTGGRILCPQTAVLLWWISLKLISLARPCTFRRSFSLVCKPGLGLNRVEIGRKCWLLTFACRDLRNVCPRPYRTRSERNPDNRRPQKRPFPDWLSLFQNRYRRRRKAPRFLAVPRNTHCYQFLKKKSLVT